MKRLLVVSFLLNVGLALCVVCLWQKLTQARLVTASTTKDKTPAAQTPPARLLAASKPGHSGTNTFHWASVESGDYRVYIANLRQIGCPDATVRDIIVADVTQLYAEKESVLRAGLPRFEFWKSESPEARTAATGEVRQQLRALAADKRRVLELLLGPGAADAVGTGTGEELDLDPRMDHLPVSRQREIRSLEYQFRGAVAEALEASAYGGDETEDPFAKIRRLRKEKDEAMAGLLTPAEKEEYDLRVSATAEAMRRQLAGFSPTEEEFRTILRLRKPVENEFAMEFTLFDTERAKQEREATGQMEARIKQALGEQRFAEYQRALQKGEGGEH
ncbi:MAG TPA: hypothetical protein VHH73_15735 [Verrucomicrobiae bacterium]|nr:hypothetical protein [Verrucomicrobiae bacterium]